MKIFNTLFLVFVLSNLCAQVVDVGEGLVAYYSFSESLEDQTENNYSGFSDFPPTFIEDMEGNSSKAAYFDGVNSYVEINSTVDLNFALNDNFAISLWVKPDEIQEDLSGSINDILSKWNSQLNQGYPYFIRLHNHMSPNAGKIVVGRFDGTCGNQSLVLSETTILDGEWHHILFQKRDETLELYIDCKLEGTSEDILSCSPSNEENITIGQRNIDLNVETRKYKGMIDEIRVYNQFLDDVVNEALCNNNVVSNKEEKLDLYSSVIIGPNPIYNQQKLNILNLDNELIESVVLYSSNGNASYLDNSFSIPSALNSGMYYCVITLTNGETILRKLIIHSLRV